MYINRYTYEGGNPFLLPSLSHNITLGTTYKPDINMLKMRLFLLVELIQKMILRLL